MNTPEAIAARIISVGDELLLGRSSDTNATRIERALAPFAIPVRDILVIADRIDAIAAALERTAPEDLVFLCGGLGSTADDVTRAGLAAWAGVALEHREDIAAALAQRRRRRGLPVLSALAGGDPQALVPAGMTPVANPVGSAPGLVGRLRDRRLIVLPGVPQELEALLPAVLAACERFGALPPARRTVLWRTAQLAEMALANLIEPVRERYADLQWSYWLVEWGVDLFVRGGAAQQPELAAAAQEIDALLGDAVYGRQMMSLPRVVQELMLAQGKTLAVAESCTGGRLGAAITAEPGSSGYFLGGVVSYADAVKCEIVGVDSSTLAAAGAVSGRVAEDMAVGIRRRLGADYALAVTGIAGPGGGTAQKPIGTTWLALAGLDAVWSGCCRYPGDRERNRQLAVAGALDSLRRALAGVPVFPAAGLSWSRPS